MLRLLLRNVGFIALKDVLRNGIVQLFVEIRQGLGQSAKIGIHIHRVVGQFFKERVYELDDVLGFNIHVHCSHSLLTDFLIIAKDLEKSKPNNRKEQVSQNSQQRCSFDDSIAILHGEDQGIEVVLIDHALYVGRQLNPVVGGCLVRGQAQCDLGEAKHANDAAGRGSVRRLVLGVE